MEQHTIPWRLASDVDLVSFEKQSMPLCTLMCKVARDRGIGDISVYEHETAKMTAPALRTETN